MTKEDFINLGLSKELASKCEEKSKEELKAYVPYSRFKELVEEKNGLQNSLKERDTSLEALKNEKGNSDELKAKIQALQDENKQKDDLHAKEIKAIKVETAIEKALTRARAKNNIAVRALLKDLETAELLEDGSVKGLEEQIKALKKSEDTKFLFYDGKVQVKGFTPADSGDKKPEGITKEEFNKMSYKDRLTIFSKNRELYEELTEA